MRAAFRALSAGSFAALLFGAAVLDASARGDSGGGHAASSSGNGAPVLNSPAANSRAATYGDRGGGVKAVTRAAESALGQCSQDNNLICIADALDAYATALRNLSPPLAPELQKLPDIVSRAARQVRHAKSAAQAAVALKTAVAEVHKTIALLKADDPVILQAETRQGGFVAETLAVAENKLEKASGL